MINSQNDIFVFLQMVLPQGWEGQVNFVSSRERSITINTSYVDVELSSRNSGQGWTPPVAKISIPATDLSFHDIEKLQKVIQAIDYLLKSEHWAY